MSDLAAAFFTDEKFAPIRPLIVDYLPGVDRADLACAFVGELMRHVRRRCPQSHFQAAMILLGHTGYHSNRAWASHWHIAELGIKLFGWDGTPKKHLKTVQRAMDFWCETFPIFRKITDQEELLSGPGEHLWVDRGNKKRGRGQTNHYDITGVQAYPPQAFAGALDALIMGEQYTPPPTPAPMPPIDLDERYPSPFHAVRHKCVAGVEAWKEREAPDISRGNDELTNAGLPNPFDEPINSTENNFSTVEAFGSIPPVVDKNDISKRLENVEMSDKYDKAGRQEKPSANLVADTRFNVTKLSNITERYGAPAPVPTRGHVRSHSRTYTREVSELVRRGVDEGMAVTMRVKTRAKWGDEESRKWLRALLAYGVWKGKEDETTYEGGWYNAVYQNWMAGTAISWPDPAMDAINRTEAAYNKSAEGRLSQSPSPQTPPLTPPPLQPFVLGEPLPVFALPPPPTEGSGVGEPLPLALPAEPPGELVRVWPAFLKSVAELFSEPFYKMHVRALSPAALTRGEGNSVAVTLKTRLAFTKATFDSKPQQVQLMARTLAALLGIDAGVLTVQIVVVTAAAVRDG